MQTPATSARDEICVEGVARAFGAQEVLCGVDLAVHEGDVLAIVGGSGCGKTVLMNHMIGELQPDRGRVLACNHSLPGAPLRDLARVAEDELEQIRVHWGVVFQRNALFSGSVYDNIALWLSEVRGLRREQILPIARRALEAVALPADDGFLALSHESLSGGMAKRLAVARAISMRPAVIFYDEPTTGLDPASSAQIHDLIGAMHTADGSGDTAGSRRTTIIITHDKDLLARLEPRVVMLHEGKVFFDGCFQAFRASRSPIVRPYFDVMPMLHAGRTTAA